MMILCGIWKITTPTVHTMEPGSGAVWIFCRAIFIIFDNIPIPTPFPDISAHIVNTQLIWFFLTHNVWKIACISHVPGYFIKGIASAVFVVLRMPPSPASILPFRFCGQPVTIRIEITGDLIA
jgi:hypothetical protein